MKMSDNPMSRANAASRCGAKNRQDAPCGRFALRGKKRCEFHGGKSPGAPRGEQHGMYKHGQRTIEAMERVQEARAIIRAARKLMAML